MEIFSFNGYWGYVWACYALTLGLFLVLGYRAIKSHAWMIKRLQKYIKHRKVNNCV